MGESMIRLYSPGGLVRAAAGAMREPVTIVDVPIADLSLAEAPARMGGAKAAHVRLLAEAEAALPPIVVHRESMQVIDGVHRLRAAEVRGDETIGVVFFEGTAAEAFVLGVRLNTMHGLPLSLAERKAAALRILVEYPEWSDRAIAGVAGLSPKTVSAIRRRSDVESPQSAGRIASNGVLHRSIGPEGRRRAAELFEADPGASARTVALAAGISVTTAKDVRKRLRAGEDPVTARGRAAEPAPPEPARNVVAMLPACRGEPEQLLHQLRKDPSLRFSETGRKVLRWLEAPFGDDVDWESVIDTLPSHCAPGIAELARRRSHDWNRLAHLLDRRTRDDSPASSQ
ncbi:hypothetical protein AWN90_15060 [Nocardia terpenica]|uniref:ParB-like N-terminal domain-containing protein n=2 Tax=Nocardia terpenica TaxID=455432 RepID=A0A164I324_9NOCA|nr:hypothetical protein AWN90_15060 [Nocardia terpenica]